MSKSPGHSFWRYARLIPLAIVLVCLILYWMWSQDWGLFAPNPPYKPYSYCSTPDNTLPANAGWSAVVPDSSWEGWEPPKLDNIYNGTPYLEAVAIDSKGQVYVAGNFSQIGGLAASGIARWHPASQRWYGLADGLLSRDNAIYELKLLVDAQDRVYVSGSFAYAGGQIVNGIALWDGQAWSSLQGGLMDGGVNAMALDGNGGLYIGGSFTQVGTLHSPGIAHWNGKAWDDAEGLADSLAKQTGIQSIRVRGIAFDATRGILYASGADRVGNYPFLATWKLAKPGWSMITLGKSSRADHLALDPSGGLYVAGWNELVAGSNGIARYAEGDWSRLGSGLTRFGTKTGSGMIDYSDFYVGSMAVDRAGLVTIGGNILAVGGKCVYGLAHWNGREWESLGSGVLINNRIGFDMVNSIAFDTEGNLYVAGGFQSAGGKPIRYLARWKP
jgi:trimeric autotransporter adhesin